MKKQSKSKTKPKKIYLMVNVPNGLRYGGEWELSKKVATIHLKASQEDDLEWEDDADEMVYTIMLEATVAPSELKKLVKQKERNKRFPHKLFPNKQF